MKMKNFLLVSLVFVSLGVNANSELICRCERTGGETFEVIQYLMTPSGRDFQLKKIKSLGTYSHDYYSAYDSEIQRNLCERDAQDLCDVSPEVEM